MLLERLRLAQMEFRPAPRLTYVIRSPRAPPILVLRAEHNLYFGPAGIRVFAWLASSSKGVPESLSELAACGICEWTVGSMDRCGLTSRRT